MLQPFDSIRSLYRNLEPSSALDKPTSILLGISQPAANALNDVDIFTVFDLASSAIFANAVDICLLAESGQGRFAATGKVPYDALRDGHDKPITELPLQPISILSTHSPKTELDTLAVAMDIASIREFAAWPPYRTARELLDRVYNPLSIAGALDGEAPADLVPSNGQYPTERVQYEVLLFDEFVGGAAVAPIARPLGMDGPLDISELLSNNGGYERPAIGGVLTFTQSWYTKGLSLGHLIHGIALAPGESTKIAMIDWSRRVRTSATETIQEGEQLDSDLSRARSISEITSAVARETQTGQSAAHSASVATQSGASTGYAGTTSPFDPISFGGTAFGVRTSGTSLGTSTGVSDATSWSTSSGQREVGASLAQDIVDRTHQASHSARNRRASIVREVSQTESESISTRTLTNYNHMHALTVEYYEVVQLYRTVVELSKADRCLFVPMKLVNFRDPAIRSRFRHVLGISGLIPKVRALMFMEPDQVALSASHRIAPWAERDLGEMARVLERPVGQGNSPYLTLPTNFSQGFGFGFSEEAPIDQAIVTFASGNSATFGIEDRAELQNYWNARFSATTGDTFNVAHKGYDFSDVRRIELVKKKDNEDYTGTLSITLTFLSNDIAMRLDSAGGVAMHTSVEIPKDLARFPIFELIETFSDEELTKHLIANQLYYSQVIWRALDPATIGILLSAYTWPVGRQAKPLVEFVDPNPVAIVANYLVLRISGDDDREYTAWLDKKKIKVGSRREDQIPIPSGGVFAEAVLGRFNSAEKLDITRFWNWQDSPIPIQAPDIAAIQAGSRRDPDNTVPGQLSAPVLNIVNPPALPDPQGMGAILAAIQNGNMFRDMSGLAATIGLAQAGLAGAQQGATDAAAQAGKNAEVAAQFGAKLAETAAKLVAAYFTGGASLAAGGSGGQDGMINSDKGMSKAGSILNYARDMDKRGIGHTPSGHAVIPALEAGGGNGVGSTSDAATSEPTGRNEGAAFSTALGGGRPLLASADAGFVPDAGTGIGVSIAGIANRVVDPNETIVLTANVQPAGSAVYWSGGGVPATANGTTFTTRFPISGQYQITASVSGDAGAGARATVNVSVRELSGVAWVARFPQSTSTADLVQPFRTNIEAFIAALTVAGAPPNINTTFRPRERAYLMHWAPQVANGAVAPNAVPSEPGVDICWHHRRADGTPDIAVSQAAAQQMSNGYNVAFPAAFPTHHSDRLAIDMTITWTGNITVNNATGNPVLINTQPRDGAGNAQLHAVGATYGVIKLIGDPPHWSDNGH